MRTATSHEYQVGTGAVFFYSLLFHAVVILVAIVGLPHVKKEFEAPQPISVEIAMIDEEIKTKEPPKKEPVQKKEEKPVETPKRALTQPKKEPIKKAPPKEEVKPKVEKPVEKKVTPPPPKESVLKKPDIKKPKPPKKEEANKEDPAVDPFAAILKNLAPEEEASNKPKNPQQGKVSKTVTADELSALRQQLANCWSLLPGARDADKLAVELRIRVLRDRTVQSVDIVDMSRYRVDPFFRAAADNAVRAVRNPSCSPLNLPPNKYDLWKDIIFNFDPRGMF